MSLDAAVPAVGAPAGEREPTRAWALANLVATQLGWFACVLGAAHGQPWLGTATAVLVVAWHLGRAPRGRVEARLVLATILLGSSFDAALQATGALAFVGGHWLPGLGPHWMTALWALFAVTLNVLLRWLHGRWALCALLGAIAGPLSFAGGARLGAATLSEPVLALGLIGAGWAVMLPLLVALAMRFDGVGTEGAVAKR
ncbi:MAG TPA: DUF2878 domain-containing protein [Methylibium sp.]|uniref:DUF2878 domain-containing protein n=1 Tax=Methylibium sp. TaxID=2067992 RepID=UPI002DB99FA4|nr:DUF2878 domain-containing protein [Methylibium sp.]HEU4459404.1 DUF2878 domain-containing protein [Methylibium sp.]